MMGDSLTEEQRLRRGIIEEQYLAIHNALTAKWIKEGRVERLSDGRDFHAAHAANWQALDAQLEAEDLLTDIEKAVRYIDQGL